MGKAVHCSTVAESVVLLDAVLAWARPALVFSSLFSLAPALSQDSQDSVQWPLGSAARNP